MPYSDKKYGWALRHVPEFSGLLLLLAFIGTGWLVSQARSQTTWLLHTQDVEFALQRLLSAVQDAETGVRGYVITHDEAFLEPFQRGEKLVSTEFATASNLTADNSARQQSLSELKPIIEQRISELRQRIEEMRRGETNVAGFRTGKALMDDLRKKIAAMQVAEANLFAERAAASNRTVDTLIVFVTMGALLSIVALWTWVNKLRESYSNVRRSNDALLQTIADRELAETKVRQLQKMEAIGQLTGGISHDFNNMLAVIISALTLIKRRLAQGDTNIGQLVDAGIDGAGRAATLTKRLLAFARQQPLNPTTINANTLVTSMHDLISRSIGESVKTETILAAGLWPISTDQSALENALLNLAVNARDAMPEGGKITIETANTYIDDQYARAHSEVQPGQYVMIAVTDTGSGMTPEVAAKAFEPFFTTKDTGKGTGLGLSQVHGFLKQSSGHIKIYSEVGTGTTVKMYFPRQMQSDSAAEIPVSALPRGSDAEVILVVEDDQRVRELTVAMVRELGYTAVHADGAASALSQLEGRSDIALLFTDIVMPEVNGRKLADEAVRRQPNLRVLFTTGFTRNAVVHNGILDAGVDLLVKPFTLDQLAIKLREIIS
jgi:signal transduction histidine kinase